MKIVIIAAIGNQNQLGKNNDLLWYLPEDLKNFKNLTKGNSILMGRKTFESLPGILPDRRHYVVSRSIIRDNRIHQVNSIEDAILGINSHTDTLFIIGGGQIYKEALDKDLVDEMWISHVDYNGDADVFFPKIDTSKWEITEIKKYPSLELSWNLVYYRRV